MPKTGHPSVIWLTMTWPDRILVWLVFVHLYEFRELPSALLDPSNSNPGRIVNKVNKSHWFGNHLLIIIDIVTRLARNVVGKWSSSCIRPYVTNGILLCFHIHCIKCKNRFKGVGGSHVVTHSAIGAEVVDSKTIFPFFFLPFEHVLVIFADTFLVAMGAKWKDQT